jgi:hypothetical protein
VGASLVNAVHADRNAWRVSQFPSATASGVKGYTTRFK